jgi:putative beta barrel porin BBP7
MNSMRLAVGILFVVLASNTCTLAMAQDLAQSSEASVRLADPPEDSVFLSAAQEEEANLVGPDERFQQASSAVSDATASAFDQQPSAAPSITKLPNDCLDGCFRRCCINPCPCAYVQVGALFLQGVPRFSNQPIIVDPNTNTTFLSTSNFNSNFTPGLYATVGMRVWGCRYMEFDYFGLFGGTASAVAVKPDPAAFLTFPDNLVGNVFVDMDRAQVNYSSSLQSFAVNFPCCCGCCDGCGCGGIRYQSITWFAGFRYLNLSERLNIAAQRTVGGAVEDGNYNVRTTNNLYGAQLGARVRRWRGRFGWDASGFAGIFANAAQQKQSVTDFPNFPLRPVTSSNSTGAAFVGGTNLSALYGLTTVWNLRAGYNLIWIQGLALAPDQLDFNFAAAPSGDQIHNRGGLFLHGANVGLEARW